MKDYNTTLPENSWTWNTAGSAPGDVLRGGVGAGAPALRRQMKRIAPWTPYELTTSGSRVTQVTLIRRLRRVPQSSQRGLHRVTWTASALDGTAPYEYRFWTYNPGTGP